jgi:hypothetical protein
LKAAAMRRNNALKNGVDLCREVTALRAHQTQWSQR